MNKNGKRTVSFLRQRTCVSLLDCLVNPALISFGHQGCLTSYEGMLSCTGLKVTLL